ncbi:MAG: SemiSWEET family transporter [candidate division SR1 bacterium]|nr:SemiSWEET family transporter [candidate division SR1 bacterium]
MDKTMFMKIFQVLTTIVGIVMSIGYFPQAYKLYKTKSAENISILSFCIFAAGTFIWTLYGILIGDRVLILSFVVGVVGSRLVLGLAITYKKKKYQKK